MIKSVLDITLNVLLTLVATKVDTNECEEYAESQSSYANDENDSPIIMLSPLGFRKEK